MTAPVSYDDMSTTSLRSEPMFTKCCCCIPLRTGCLILGYLNLVYSLLYSFALVYVTTYLAFSTHGFDHFDSDQPALEDRVDEEALEKPSLAQMGFLLILVHCFNVAWLVVKVACLVGVHKKRPGPIRVYIGFASARLLLTLAGFVYLTANNTSEHIFSQSVDLGLSAYFLFVYYVYAMQLERERLELPRVAPEVFIVGDNAFIYPDKMDMEHLVMKH